MKLHLPWNDYFICIFIWYFDNKDKTEDIKTQIIDLNIKFIRLLSLSTILIQGCISCSLVEYQVIVNVLSSSSMVTTLVLILFFSFTKTPVCNFILELTLKSNNAAYYYILFRFYNFVDSALNNFLNVISDWYIEHSTLQGKNEIRLK